MPIGDRPVESETELIKDCTRTSDKELEGRGFVSQPEEHSAGQRDQSWEAEQGQTRRRNIEMGPRMVQTQWTV